MYAEFRKKLIEKLIQSDIDANEAKPEVDLVIESVCGLTKKDVALGKFENVFKNEAKIIEIIAKRASSKRPIQQILGFAYFMGEKFIVDENTLIPRPETEILVKHVAEFVNEHKTILDIGTGSGCIACMLAKMAGAKVKAVDISESALSIARENALNLGVEVDFIQSDLFGNVEGKFDIIVSNPPYISKNDKPTLQTEVLNFEPHSALFTQDELGLEFYQKIISQARNYLKNGAIIAFELGAGQSEEVSGLLRQSNFSDIKIIKDLSGIDRVISARKVGF